MQSNEVLAASADDVLEITRVFDAQRALVWRLWADPAHRMRWWGPEGFSLHECEVDFRVGGQWRVLMVHVSGEEHRVVGEFREIREPSRLSFTYTNSDDHNETLVTLDFSETGGKTRMQFRQASFPSAATRDAHAWGWSWSFALFAEYAPKIDPVGMGPMGPPRSQGMAADIIAARAHPGRRTDPPGITSEGDNG